MMVCDFPGSREIGKPSNWIEDLDGPCLSIYVADSVDTLTGANMMFSVYKPTDEEIEELKNGGLIRLGIMGTAHPVFQLAVLSSGMAELAKVTPCRDLGGVITGEDLS